jgi:hypothetical protein
MDTRTRNLELVEPQLMLRAGGHWSRLAGLPKSFLHRA